VAKGYWLARVDVTDAEAYKAYVTANAKAFAKYRARFLVRAGGFVVKEGSSRVRNVVIEFDDYATALTCCESPESAESLPYRQNASVADIGIIEGYEGPQPS
jgi:uncharacterized protein (DUF1330 family)